MPKKGGSSTLHSFIKARKYRNLGESKVESKPLIPHSTTSAKRKV